MDFTQAVQIYFFGLFRLGQLAVYNKKQHLMFTNLVQYLFQERETKAYHSVVDLYKNVDKITIVSNYNLYQKHVSMAIYNWTVLSLG